MFVQAKNTLPRTNALAYLSAASRTNNSDYFYLCCMCLVCPLTTMDVIVQWEVQHVLVN
jgi:hypothetical protein